MDRLAAYYHWNDQQSLIQALMIVKGHVVDYTEIKEWSKKEGMEDKYEHFKKRIKI